MFKYIKKTPPPDISTLIPSNWPSTASVAPCHCHIHHHILSPMKLSDNRRSFIRRGEHRDLSGAHATKCTIRSHNSSGALDIDNEDGTSTRT